MKPLTAYNASMSFCKALDDMAQGDENPTRVTKGWHNVFCTVLSDMGFPKKARKYLWDNMLGGNWSRLHLTEDEEAVTGAEWLGALRDDVWYCSDRWTFDRLMRCHWRYCAWDGRFGSA